MKGFLTLSALLIASLSFSQTIGKIAPLGEFVAELTYSTNGNDTAYVFTFNDKKYTKIDALKTVSFSGSINEFYTAVKSVFTDENKKNKDYSTTISLGKEQVIIKGLKSMGILQAMIYVKEGYTALTEKQVDKLFGH